MMSSNFIQFQLGPNVVLVCSRRVCGPSPLHGTIVNNVETDRSKQAFNTRVGLTVPLYIFLFYFHFLLSSSQYFSHFHFLIILHGTIVNNVETNIALCWWSSLNIFVFLIVFVFVIVFVNVFFLVRSCLFITLIKCLKGHKSLASLFEGVL